LLVEVVVVVKVLHVVVLEVVAVQVVIIRNNNLPNKSSNSNCWFWRIWSGQPCRRSTRK
jgi:hypothetical protein